MDLDFGRMFGMNDSLKRIYAEIETLNDELPADLSRKVTLHSLLLQRYGMYHAAAVRDHGKAYADRKRIWGQTIMDSKGTAKDKEAAAEIAAYDARVTEAETEMEVWKWKNLCASTTEIINAVKIELRTLMKEYDNAG